MQPKSFTRKLSQSYLCSVIPLGLLFGVAPWHLNYQAYVPLCLLNALLMAISAWVLGAHKVRSHDVDRKHFVFIASCLIVPWALIFLFAFLGAPPESPADFVATGTEQKIRYALLIVSGLLSVLGLAVLKEKMHAAGESFYSTIGLTVMMIAVPLFVIEMAYWGNFALELFKLQLASPSGARPDWFRPIYQLFYVAGIAEVTLMYLATAAFAAGLKSISWLGKVTANSYIVISLIAAVLVATSPLYFKGFFPLMIPAMPFILPLFIGIGLMRKAGD